jgi:hypothetical protein
MFVDKSENRDLISSALGAQIPNPGSIRSRAKREIFVALVLLGVMLQRCHFGGPSLPGRALYSAVLWAFWILEFPSLALFVRPDLSPDPNLPRKALLKSGPSQFSLIRAERENSDASPRVGAVGGSFCNGVIEQHRVLRGCSGSGSLEPSITSFVWGADPQRSEIERKTPSQKDPQ